MLIILIKITELEYGIQTEHLHHKDRIFNSTPGAVCTHIHDPIPHNPVFPTKPQRVYCKHR